MFLLEDDGKSVHSSIIDIGSRWRELAHVQQRTRAMVLIAGESIATPWMRLGVEPTLAYELFLGLPMVSHDGLDSTFVLERRGQDALVLSSHRITNSMPNAGHVSCEISVPVTNGDEFRLVLYCGPGPSSDPIGDWLGVSLFVAAPREDLSLARASAHKSWRFENELAHFASVYSKDFYRDRQVARNTAEIKPIRRLPVAMSTQSGLLENRSVVPEEIQPLACENAFTYSLRLLDSLLPVRPPDFVQRLKSVYEQNPGKRVRMLSLCAGEAAIEGKILEVAGVPVDLCLLDINEDLLEVAASRMPECVVVDRVLGDANELQGQLGAFDVVNITSGLHHLVQIERVLSGIARSLGANGEFWLIGEQIGRNGNRLWPEALLQANQLFSAWPSAKRINANTGICDELIPDVDYSTACFEGIRSEDIMPALQRYFLPVDVYVRNCFLWRLFDVAYASNFDISQPKDVALLRSAVLAEFTHWVDGGRGTELHAVFVGK